MSAGDFLLSVFASGRAYAIIGDRLARLEATGSWDPPSRPDSFFRTSYRRDRWHYRFGGGVRILWAPE